MSKCNCSIAVFLLTLLVKTVELGFSPTITIAADVLSVGSDAPPLDIEHWLSNGQGKFDPVQDFKPGKVYVIEFWATWCGPCIQSMPHLAELQKQFDEGGVQIISVSDEDLDTVKTFLDREYLGKADSEEEIDTYGQLTSAYCLTTDPDGSTYMDYMQAAGLGGIPNAFIVGKDAKIEWIGHPMEMDQPLQAVVNDSWNREAYIQQLKRQKEAEKLFVIAGERAREENFEGALELIDQVIELQQNELKFKLQKLVWMVEGEKLEAAEKYLLQLFDESENVSDVDTVAWNIYRFAAQGFLPEKQLIPVAIERALQASERAEQLEKSSLLDTVAHLQFVNGELDQAIQTEIQAAELAGDQNREFIQRFLNELKEAKQAEKDEKEDTSR